MKLLRISILAISSILFTFSCVKSTSSPPPLFIDTIKHRVYINGIINCKVEVYNDGHGPYYMIMTPKGCIGIIDVAMTLFDHTKYNIYKRDTIDGVNICYGVFKNYYYREDKRPSIRICYDYVLAKDTMEFNTILNNIIITPK